MKQKTLYKVFIWGFLFLYLLVATISFFHAVQFFAIGNNTAMSVTLALAFEIGLALSLAAILLSDENKKSTLPWILMIVLTLVQVIGNVYSTFKYISLSEEQYYQYLAKPLLFWMEGVTEDTVQIIVSWIIGAILPIIALFMTDMVASNIKNLEKTKELPDTEITQTQETVAKEEEKEETQSKPGKGQITIPKSFPITEEEKPVIQEEKLVKQDENDVSEDFTTSAVQKEEQVQAEEPQKTTFLQRFKNMWKKK
jgi:hypothetical protein